MLDTSLENSMLYMNTTTLEYGVIGGTPDRLSVKYSPDENGMPVTIWPSAR